MDMVRHRLSVCVRLWRFPDDLSVWLALHRKSQCDRSDLRRRRARFPAVYAR